MAHADDEPEPPDATTRELVALQIGRWPREPWRVRTRCGYGYPSVIVSPAVLEDGSRFPTLLWLTCPWLIDAVGALESRGATDEWAERAAADPVLAEALRAADAALRRTRKAESGGVDICEDVGLAGQRDPLGVKCVHAHVALALAGIDDPVGQETLERIGYPCGDERCAALLRSTNQGARS